MNPHRYSAEAATETSDNERGRCGVDLDLTCSLCLDVFRDPRLLPCRHAFCQHCLHGLLSHSATPATTSPSPSFACPQCRHVVHVPAGGVTHFPQDVSFPSEDLEEARKRQDAADVTRNAARVIGNNSCLASSTLSKEAEKRSRNGSDVTRSDVFEGQTVNATASTAVSETATINRPRGVWRRFKHHMSSKRRTGSCVRNWPCTFRPRDRGSPPPAASSERSRTRDVWRARIGTIYLQINQVFHFC